VSPHGRPKGERPRSAGRREAPGVHHSVSVDRRLAFARARTPVAVAMRVAAAVLAARRSVFSGPRSVRRVGVRDATIAKATMPPRGCEDLH
jgi:hypothetical protein